MDVARVRAEVHDRPEIVVGPVRSVPALPPPSSMMKRGFNSSFLNGRMVRSASGRAWLTSSMSSRAKTPGERSTGATSVPNAFSASRKLLKRPAFILSVCIGPPCSRM